MIDDGPLFKLAMYRAVKRFDLEISKWPTAPSGFADFDESLDYWRCRFELVLFQLGLGIQKLIEAGKISIEAQYEPVPVQWAPLMSTRIPDTLTVHHPEDFYDLDVLGHDVGDSTRVIGG